MKDLITITAIALCAFFLLKNCEKDEVIASQDEAIAMYQHDEQFFVKELDSLSRQIASQEVIIVQYEDKIQAILGENSGLKKKIKILSQEKIKLEFKLDSLVVPVDSTSVVLSEDCKNGYSYGTVFRVNTEFFAIKVKLQPYGVTIPTLSVPIDLVATHYADGTFEVFSKNPYVDIVSISSISQKMPNKFSFVDDLVYPLAFLASGGLGAYVGGTFGGTTGAVTGALLGVTAVYVVKLTIKYKKNK